jgi:hypothetical protein
MEKTEKRADTRTAVNIEPMNSDIRDSRRLNCFGTENVPKKERVFEKKTWRR